MRKRNVTGVRLPIGLNAVYEITYFGSLFLYLLKDVFSWIVVQRNLKIHPFRKKYCLHLQGVKVSQARNQQ